jgi:hypothetical protein
VAGWTLASLWRTPAPGRWLRPQSGGCSGSSVPRPRAPFSRWRRPARPFLSGFWVSFGTCPHVHFVPLHFPAQADLGLRGDNPRPPLARPLLHVVFVEVECLGALRIGEVQAPEGQAQDPRPSGLRVACDNCPCQVINLPPAGCALIALPLWLGFLPPACGSLWRGAVRTGYPLWPVQLADGVITLGGIEQVLNLQPAVSRKGREANLKPPLPRFPPTSLESLLSQRDI